MNLTAAPFSLDSLHPAAVWQHFSTLCRIPRQSKQEQALRTHLCQWAEVQGLSYVVDTAGNLLIRRPASPGVEHLPGVVLQGHLDMVCQANSGTTHDFSCDPITPVVQDGWLVAENTTLGADNGIGVALGLAALTADIPHPAIEVLLTVDEEAGMGGAHGLDSDVLQGQYLINLDTEAWGEVYLGCAGGLDVDVYYDARQMAVPEGYRAYTLSLTGLRGGHSGVNIHEERGNAIKLLIRVLQELSQSTEFYLFGLQGGTARNALPREAFSHLVLNPSAAEKVSQQLRLLATNLLEELAEVDPNLCLALHPATVATPLACLSPEGQNTLLAALHAAPHGVKRMSQAVPGVVETSNNLGILQLHEGRCHANFMVRSLRNSGSHALGAEIASLFRLIGADIDISGHYPGWTPNPSSPLLAIFHRVYAQEYGVAAQEQVIHAGLECGIIGAKYPKLDMISFGPTIHGAHAPGERVDIASVGQCWDLLQALLRELAR